MKFYRTFGIIYIIMSFFLFIFVNKNDSTDFADYTVFFINGKVVIIHFVITIVFFLVFLLIKIIKNDSIKIDTVVLCLIIKVFLDVISVAMTFGTLSEHLAWLAITFSCLISYLIIINSHLSNENMKLIKRIIIIFGIIVSVQVYYTFLKCPVSYTDALYKRYINIPYGGTNIISSFLIPIILLIYFEIKKPIFKWIFIAILMGAVIITKSRGGIVLSSIVLFVLLMQKNGKRFIVLKRAIVVSLFVLLFTLLISNENIISLFIGSTNSLDFNKISSNRLSIWKTMLDSFEPKYYVLGLGMKPILVDSSGAHNILIDMFIRLGIIGFINYSIALMYPLFKGKQLNKDQLCPFYFMGLIILINSLFEVSYFYYGLDVVFWIYFGLTMSRTYSQKLKE